MRRGKRRRILLFVRRMLLFSSLMILRSGMKWVLPSPPAGYLTTAPRPSLMRLSRSSPTAWCRGSLRLVVVWLGLHTFTVLELELAHSPTSDILKVVLKSMVASLRHDLLDFVLARRACRRHVLQFAKVRHEPTRLIDGPVWGRELFPAALVKEAVEAATRASQSLRARWDLSSFKRKSQEGSGAQPKNRKRFCSSSNYKIPKLPQAQATMMLPCSMDGQPIPGASGIPYVPMQVPQQSPVNNQHYQRSKFRNAGYSASATGGRGGESQTRGKGLGHHQPRERGGHSKGSGAGCGAPMQ